MEYKKYAEIILQALGIDFINKKIVIYGAGANGQRIAASLKKMDIPVWGFCDNNQMKQGTQICGIPCFSPSVLDGPDDFSVIISLYEQEQLCEKLLKRYQGSVSGRDFNLFSNLSVFSGYTDFFPLGHFYSLYPELEKLDNDLFCKEKEIPDIDFREKKQIELLKEMRKLYDSLPEWECLGSEKQTKYRYQYLNPSFSPGDTVLLHCMLRLLKPKKMIEVGSGWSSAVTLDTNEYFLNNKMELTFIEPYPALLQSILKESDHINLISEGLQEVPVKTFQELLSGDILFIDSTHVSKIGSDVNYLFFNILPALNKGVYVHLHDIFYPFEYPKEWLLKGMVWNELYLLRAFLMNNKDYEIIFFQNMMEQKHIEVFLEQWPLEYQVHGGSIWLKKVK